MKHIKAQLEALKALLPQDPDFLVACWNPDSDEPKPEAPKGFQGMFVIVHKYSGSTPEPQQAPEPAPELPDTRYDHRGYPISGTPTRGNR